MQVLYVNHSRRLHSKKLGPPLLKIGKIVTVLSIWSPGYNDRKDEEAWNVDPDVEGRQTPDRHRYAL